MAPTAHGGGHRVILPSVVVRAGWIAGALAVVGCGRGPLAVLLDDDDGGGDDASDSDSGDPQDDCDLDSHTRDLDGDGIPDGDDPFCSDRSRPGRARDDVMYAHSSSTLYTVDPRGTLEVEIVGGFAVSDGTLPALTDIAIDRFGVLYGITFGELFACDPDTAECWRLATLPTNSLGFVPMGVIDDDDDTLVTLAGSAWTHVALRGAEATPSVVADVSPYSSSGDIVATPSGRTLFTSPSPSGFDVVVAIDAASGAIESELAGTGTSGAYGLATFAGDIWIFDQLGQISRLDEASGAVEWVASYPDAWWGAAARP